MNIPKKIAVLTGKRGGFGAMKPLLRLLRDSPATELQLIVTDQHLNPEFGNTIDEVKAEFDIAAAVKMEQDNDSAQGRSQALGRCLINISEALAGLKPDILVLYGDRGEVIAAAVAAIHLRIPIAHLQGGDVSGNVDEVIRHAVTKMSHMHFVSCEDSAQRILAMGEEPWRVHISGDNHIDLIVAGQYTPADEIRRKYKLAPDEKPVIVLLHPETIRDRDHEKDAALVFGEVARRKEHKILVYPCSDHGYEGIIRAIGHYKNHPDFSIHKNIIAPDFWGLMAIASVMVGNSSAGLIEAPYFNLPAINMGKRQTGRVRAENIIDCAFSEEEIRNGLTKTLEDELFLKQMKNCSKPFGNGKAGQYIFETLDSLDLASPDFLDKRMTY